MFMCHRVYASAVTSQPLSLQFWKNRLYTFLRRL